jgi:hypothetical protein
MTIDPEETSGWRQGALAIDHHRKTFADFKRVAEQTF